MAETTHFGLTKFGSGGRISDNNYKFSNRDRETLDSLLQQLFNHDHQSTSSTALADPAPLEFPTLTLASTGGVLAAGKVYYYKFSYMDTDGNETAASTTGPVSTPTAVGAPGAQTLSTATTGGTLEPGTYKYALSFYQTAGGETTAPNISTITVPTGTSTNTITVPLPTKPTGIDGWKIYRKGPGDIEYWLLTTETAGANYVDDGTDSPDCTKKRPTTNTTNSTNKVTIAIPSNELPLDSRVTAWRIYRTSTAGSYGTNSLVVTVTETTTEGGSDLVTSYVDTGGALFTGAPLGQSTIPPEVPQLDASSVFDSSSERLPSALAPLGVRAFNILLPSTLAVKDYHQVTLPHDMLIERLDAFFLTAPTGVDGSNYVTIRVSDDSAVDEVQHISNDAIEQNEYQKLSNNATGGTFTMSFDGQGPTAATAYDAAASLIKTRLESMSNITTVNVSGTGTSADPWVIEFVNPGNQNVAEITTTDTGLTGGTSTITTTIQGSDGGTFTLSDGTDTTTAIAYDAVAATVETRLQTDITSITDVTVTGTGTTSDPWVVTFVNPGDQNVELLIASDTSLNGTTTITEAVRGRGNQQLDLDITAAQAYHFYQTSTTDSGEQQAEEAPATGGSATVSDTLASNDSAKELDAATETNSWNIGTLDAGTYTFWAEVSDYDKGSVFDVELIDLPSTAIETKLTVSDEVSTYVRYQWEDVVIDGTEDIEISVTKTDADTNRVRVDRYGYDVQLPTMYGGQKMTVEVLVTGTPTTNGGDCQFTIWY